MTDAVKATPPTEVVDYTIPSVLSRMRSTLTGWTTALAGIAGVVFGGLSLGEYVKAPATADPGIAALAQLCLVLVIVGVVMILGAAGLGAAMRAAPQDGAFRAQGKDALRFFPKDTAPDLLQEYKDEVARFNAARLRDDLKGMNEASYWMNAHSQRLWQWLDAYRARRSSKTFQTAALVVAIGALLTGLGTIGFADALRRMKTSTPADVIMQGPKNGNLSLLALGGVPAGLEACTTKVLNQELTVPVTVMSVKVPTTAQEATGVTYVASVVPPMTMIAGCVVKVYEVTSKQARVTVEPEVPAKALAPTATPTATGEKK